MYPFRPAGCRARSMVFWFSSQVAPVTFRNRVGVTGALPTAAFSARAICALIVLLSRWLRVNDHWQTTRRKVVRRHGDPGRVDEQPDLGVGIDSVLLAHLTFRSPCGPTSSSLVSKCSVYADLLVMPMPGVLSQVRAAGLVQEVGIFIGGRASRGCLVQVGMRRVVSRLATPNCLSRTTGQPGIHRPPRVHQTDATACAAVRWKLPLRRRGD
jgi:hypothetical protein